MNPNLRHRLLVRISLAILVLNAAFAQAETNKVVKQAANDPISQAEEAHRTALQYVRLGKYDQAVSAFDEAIKLDSKNAQYFLDRGLLHAKRRETFTALEDYNQSIQLNGTNAKAFIYRGNLYLGRMDWEPAEKDFNQAINLGMTNALSHTGLGNAYVLKKDYDKALKEYDTAIALDSKHARAYCGRGIVYSQRKELEKALNDLNKAIELSPGNDEYYFRGFVYMENGDYDKAIQDFTMAIERSPQDARCFVARSNAYKGKGEIGKSARDAAEAMRLDPRYEIMLNRRATNPDSKSKPPLEIPAPF